MATVDPLGLGGFLDCPLLCLFELLGKAERFLTASLGHLRSVGQQRDTIGVDLKKAPVDTDGRDVVIGIVDLHGPGSQSSHSGLVVRENADVALGGPCRDELGITGIHDGLRGNYVNAKELSGH